MVELTEGGLAIATSVGMAVRVDDLTIAPAARKLSRFEVAEDLAAALNIRTMHQLGQ